MAKKRAPKPPGPGRHPPQPPVTADTPLSDDERLFLAEWTVDRNAAQAYRRCYPEASYQSCLRLGSQMRRRVNVAAECQAHLRACGVRANVSADEVLKECARLAFSDVLSLYDPQTNQLLHPRHIPFDTRRCVASIKVVRQRTTRTTVRRTTTTVTDQIVEYKLWDKVAALGRLAKLLGMDHSLDPLETLLALLPRKISDNVRAELAAERQAMLAPSTNGNGKH